MVLPDIKKLRELIKLLKSQGVLQYQSTDLNLVFSEQALVQDKYQSDSQEMAQERELSPEEEAERILFLSATHPTEIAES